MQCTDVAAVARSRYRPRQADSTGGGWTAAAQLRANRLVALLGVEVERRAAPGRGTPHDRPLGDRASTRRTSAPVGGHRRAAARPRTRALRLGDGEPAPPRRRRSDSSTTAPSPRAGRGGPGTRPSHSSACQAKWRAWRARSELQRRLGGCAAPSRRAARRAAARAHARSRCARPTRRSRPASSLRSRRAACHASAGSRGTGRRGQTRTTAMPARITTAPTSSHRAEPLAVDVAGDAGEHRLRQQDERGTRRRDPPLAPQLERQRDRGARDAGEHDRERR